MDAYEYSMEELLPVIAKLTDQYTSKESSSVTYDIARMLLGAVVYCVNERDSAEDEYTLSDKKTVDPLIAWETGARLVLKKAAKAKAIYESCLIDFEDYGCENYKSTILDGMPAFFQKYDPKFNPQNHILTLDYPLLSGNPTTLSGVDLILEYLQAIQYEKQLLECFNKEAVIRLLERVQEDYGTLYYDNLCYPLLLNGIGCMIVDKSLHELILTKVEIQEMAGYFAGESIDKIALRIEVLLTMMLKQMGLFDVKWYFTKCVRDYAARIYHGIQNDTLGEVIVSI
jgi:uncharacterized protein with HEPN domain